MRVSNHLTVLAISLLAASLAACGGQTDGSELFNGNDEDSGDGDSGKDTSTPDENRDSPDEDSDTTDLPNDDGVPPDTNPDEEPSGNPCFDCAADKCSSSYNQCVDNPKCWGTVECILDSNCISNGGIDQQCAGLCAVKNGITSFDDPAINVAYSLGQCLMNSCAAACGQ
ncbi:MAG: hypothetical protein FWD57_04800 [Polyangiaceae bacterium]|nr:hypothetical protein [Polyangiaceae bacterium]